MPSKKDGDKVAGNLDKRFDEAADRAGKVLEQGTASFFSNVGQGIKKLYYKQEERKKFLVRVGFLFSVLLEISLVASDMTSHKVVGFLYTREIPILPYPGAQLVFILGVLLFLYWTGGSQNKLHEKFKIAFERAGLYSKRKVPGEENKMLPEYPQVMNEKYLEDDGIFRNPGIPLSEWKKALPSLEATLEKKLGSPEPYRKNTGFIRIKVGGSDLPDRVEYSPGLVKGVKSSQVVLGVDVEGNRVIHDFKRVPHLLIAGLTGSGKSVELRCVAYQAMEQQQANLWAIDFKGGIEFENFEPHGVDCVWEREKAMAVLTYLITEHNARIALFKENGVKNIDEWNQKGDEPLKRCYIVIDELAELTDSTGAPKEEKVLFEVVDRGLSTIARLCRATGIHLLPATQRPDAKVITGQIKTNIGGRVSGQMSDTPASMLVLGSPEASKMEEHPGRFLYSTGGRKVTKFQAPLFEDKHMNPNVKVDYSDGMLTNYYEYLDEMATTPSLASKQMRSKNIL